MRHGLLVSLGALLGGAALLFAPGARAQSEGFAIDRFEPSERGSEWFQLESLDLRGHVRGAAGLVLDYARKPLVRKSPSGDEIDSVVKDQFFAHVGGSLILWERVRFALSMPVALYQNGTAGETASGRFELKNKFAAGDLRLGGDVRLVGRYDEPFTLAAGVRVFLPTGSQDSYTSDGTVRVTAPRVSIAGNIQAFTYAAQLGVQFRPNNDDFAGSPKGSEAVFGAAVGLRLADNRLVVGPEFVGSTVFADSDALFAKRTTPFEVILGGHFLATDEIRIGAGVAPGLTSAFGTPKYRALASIEWVGPFHEPAPPPAPLPPMDRDRDSIFDRDDACPDTPGVQTNDPSTNGCPPPPDRDGDGVLNELDACPDTPGVPSDDPEKNGCPPPPDRDGDSIPDDIDACPDEAGIKTEDPKTNGCPPPRDSDGDGILDPEDACPTAPGEKNEDPKKNGCPVAHIEKGQIRIREQVQFAYNSAQILRASDFILDEVLKIFNENPEVTMVEIQGHTDSKGSDEYNKRLSNQRANSVMQWLVRRGVDKKRLRAMGYGEEQPIDTNDTDEGRANNRRVEFHIIEQQTTTEPAAAPAPTP